jgi:hypothetical protein
VLPGRKPAQEELDVNKLYKSWVTDIDIRRMLQDSDLNGKHRNVKSLLDSSVLDNIADSAISFSEGRSKRSYLSERLHVYLTLTNLQGIPYDIYFKGRSGKGHTISQHTDFMHFILAEHDPAVAEATWLDPNNSAHKNWKLLKVAALATGAFPGGLAPRVIQRDINDYNVRKWPVPQRPNSAGNSFVCTKMVNIKPSWPNLDNDHYHFLSVDGGVMDNEPLELARRKLAGNREYNSREAESADRAVIMIDPFPNEKKISMNSRQDLQEYDIINVFTELFGSLMSQARFKPDELMLANSDAIYSRYLVAPTRNQADGSRARYPIASGFLGGFGGFFSEKFRMHDFQLGRRNCQQFLRAYLNLPVDKARKNPVFAGYSTPDFEKYGIEKNGKRVVPLIPLLGSAKEEAFPLQWKTLKMSSAELTELEELIAGRTKVVLNRLIEQYVYGGFSRWIAKRVAGIKRGKIVDAVMQKVTDELEEFELK